MPQGDPPKSTPDGQHGDDFTKIGMSRAIEQGLHSKGIITYQDIAARTPDEIAAILTDKRVSRKRIDGWIEQARELAGPQPPPEPSEPRQHYASFNIEFLLESDNRVRRTKVHDHRTDTDHPYPGWDEDWLLTLLRDRVPVTITPQPTETVEVRPSVAPSPSHESAIVPSTSAELMASFLRIEELTPIDDGESGHLRRPDEPTVVRLTMRVNPTDESPTATVDFTAEIAARTWGEHERVALGTAEGVIAGNDPHSVKVTGPPLPPGLYRLTATVAVYPANHTPEAQPLHVESASGDLMGVADAPTQEAAPAVAESGGAAAEIERGRQLLESGLITQAEFDTIKAKALA